MEDSERRTAGADVDHHGADAAFLLGHDRQTGCQRRKHQSSDLNLGVCQTGLQVPADGSLGVHQMHVYPQEVADHVDGIRHPAAVKFVADRQRVDDLAGTGIVVIGIVQPHLAETLFGNPPPVDLERR